MENPSDIQPKSDTDRTVGPLIKQGWLRVLIFLFVYPFFLVAEAIFMMVITGFKITSADDFVASFDKPIMIVALAINLLLTVFFIWVFRRFVDGRTLVSLGLSFPRNIRKDFVMGIVWGGGMAAAVFGLLWMLGLVHIRQVQFPLETLLIVAIAMPLTAAQEELLMRGYVLNNLMQSANKYLSLLLVSVLFSIEHGLNPHLTFIGLLNITLAGLFLGIYYIHRQNLWFPISLHTAWNWFQGAFFGAPVSGIQIQSIFVVDFTGNEDLTGGGFGFEGSLVMTVVAVITIVLLHFIYRQPQEDSSPLPGQTAPAEK